MLDDYTQHQQKIIKRYYRNFDSIQLQKLTDLVGELYLAEGKKRERLWKNAGELMTKMEVPATRIEHILSKKDPVLLANLVKELMNSKPSDGDSKKSPTD